MCIAGYCLNVGFKHVMSVSLWTCANLHNYAEQYSKEVSFQFGASFLTRASLTRTSWVRPTATRSQFGARQFGAFSQFGACPSDARQFDAF